MTGREALEEIEAQEAALVLESFDEEDAWQLGTLLRRTAVADGLPVAITVRRGSQRLFHAALPGASADNDGWLDRKCAVVERYGRSSLWVGELFRVKGGSFDADSRLDTSLFAAHGGAFPLRVRGAGCIGSVAVSGLPQRDDHRVVVEVLTRFVAGERP